MENVQSAKGQRNASLMQKKAMLPSWLPKNALLFSVVSFLNDISSEMIFPILPIFFTAILGAPVWALGLMEGAAHFFETMMRGASGFYSDRQRKRRPLVIAGYGISAFSKMAFALASSWPLCALVRVSDRIGKGVRVTARDAILAEDSRGPKMGEIFGIRKMADSAGAVVGPVATFALLSMALSSTEEGQYRMIFLLSFIPALLGILLLFWVKEKGHKALSGPLSRQVRQMLLPKHGAWRNFLGISAVFSLGNLSYAFLVLAAVEAHIEPAHVALLYMLFNVVYMLFSVPAGILIDWLGSKKVIFLTFMAFALVCAVFSLVPLASGSFGIAGASSIIALGFAFYGIFSASHETSVRVYVAEHFPNSRLGSALGAYNIVLGIMALPAGILAGLLFPLHGPFGASLAFIFGIISSLLAAAAVLVFYKHSKHVL